MNGAADTITDAAPRPGGLATRRLRGVLAPVLTPFDAHGDPSVERLVRHCRWLLRHGVALALFGTNSEANSLSVAEKRGLLDELADAALPASKMLPGTGACALPDAVELTRHAVRLGCAGVVMLPPFFYKGVGDDGLFDWYARVIDTVADSRLRVYLYHIPAVSQVGIGFGLVERLLRHYPGTLAGIKDSSGDTAHIQRLIASFGAEGFDVFAGNETALLANLRAGGAGCVTATGNVNPAAIAALHDHWRAEDADERQRALDAVRAAFQAHPMIAAMKAALAWETGDAAWARLRPPLQALPPDASAALRLRLAALGFGIPDAAQLCGAAAPHPDTRSAT